jgi:hypothetical protein
MFHAKLWVRIASAAVVLAALGMAPPLQAQTARVSGTILDSSHAAVSGVTVTATSLATGIERSAQSTDTGAYTITNLAPSVYTFTLTKAGFSVLKFEKVTLTVDQNLTLDAKLEVGAISTSVEVTSNAVTTVDTESATLSSVVEREQITELPLILRDPYQLVLLGPGVTQSDGMGGVSVNGGRERNNNFMLDGADNNDSDVPGNLGGATAQNPDSTQEFRVLTNNFAPEYGRNNGAIIDVVTRSGSNDFHGDAFYFGRWDALGARDYFNHALDPLTGDVAPKDPYVRNLYGASLGGAIIKDKTFYFINYQGDRFVTTVTNNSIVPTAAFKTGIFDYTNLTTGATQSINVTTAGAGQNGTGVGLDPMIQKIFTYYPNPNSLSGDGVTGTLYFPSESREKDEDATIKIDHKLSANNNLFARYIYNWFADPNPFHSDTLPNGLGATPSHQGTQGFALGLTSTLGSTFTNELRFGGNRLNLFYGCSGIPEFDSVGLVDKEGRGADYELPIFASFGCPQPNNSPQSGGQSGTYQTIDNMTKVLKSHTFKWGAEFRDVYSNNFTDFSARQNLTFNIFTSYGIPALNQAALNPGIDNNLLEDEVSALLGLVAEGTQVQFFNSSGDRVVNDNLRFRQHELGLYWQDSWKVRSNLTLTYGLRWEYYGVPYEESHTLSNLFQDSSGPAPFTFSPVGPGTDHQLFKSYYHVFEPRLGFAWDPFKNGRTSIRGGVGMFSDRVYGNLVEDARGNPPFQPSFANEPVLTYGPAPGAQLQNQPLPPQLVPNPVVVQGANLFPDLFDPNIKPPSLVTWNFGFQRQVQRNLSLEANYVGNHGTRILRVVDGNPPQPQLVSQLLAQGIPPEDLEYGDLYFGQEAGFLPFDAVNNNAFGHAFTDQTTGKSWYDGLQLQATEQALRSLRIQGSYTYAHALDDSSDPLFPTVNNGSFPVDSYALSREKGNSGFDTRHRGVINFVYQPNLGRGKDHWAEGIVGRVMEGWEVSGIASWQTGLPYDIFGTQDTLHTGVADRATIVNRSILHTAPPNPSPGVPSAPVFTGFNPAAFNPEDGSIPIPFGIPSNVGRNQYYGPGINNWDADLAKTMALGDRVHFQLRFEFYNLFNRVQFAKPAVNTVGAPEFGYSTSQVGQNDGTTGARQVQIAGKFTF